MDYAAAMGRWQPDAAGRLQEAALELFDERGYENTTVAEIAERAGLTKRTFFRYFSDKREVLFSGSEELADLVAREIAAAPASTPPLDAVAGALRTAAVVAFEPRRDAVARRQRVIAAAPELRERDLVKLASLASAAADALRSRGVAESAAVVVADAGITVLKVAFERWLKGGAREDLRRLLDDALAELRTAAAA